MDSNATGVHPQHALAVYAESLASGARVAVFGDSSLGLGAKLAELGARAVHLWDPDEARAQAEAERAPRGVTIRAYAEHEADMRPIDLAIVADLGLFEDPSAIVRRVRRMVGEEGVAILSARSTEAGREATSSFGARDSRAFDYYDLFDLVAPEFESVRMIAQLPFNGVALVELGGDEAPGVTVDTQLGESGRAPDGFVVVASQRGASLEPYTIVQLASAAARAERDAGVAEAVVAEAAEAVARQRAAERDERAAERAAERDDRAAERAAMEAARAADRDALAQAQLRTELLSGQLEDLRRRLAEGERAAEAESALEEALRARSAHAADLEKSFAARGRELAELSSEVEEMRAAAEAGRIAAAQVEEVALRSDRAERRVAALEQELAKGGDTQSKELADMERVLRERAQAVRTFEIELARRDQIVRDLVGTLEELEARPAPTSPDALPSPDASPAPDAGPRNGEALRTLGEENARLCAQLDALALDLARREGEAQATAWQVTELERRLAQVAEPSAPAQADDAGRPGTERRLTQALDQLDALRTALAQEHEARARAESGEELARAHAEIQRQAVLMEQLVRELGSRPPPGFSGAPTGAAEPGPGSSEDSR
jgi:hypothetical protein